MVERRSFKRTETFEERLAAEAARLRKAAEEAAPGEARELLLTRAREAEIASHINEWLSSPGLKAPT